MSREARAKFVSMLASLSFVIKSVVFSRLYLLHCTPSQHNTHIREPSLPPATSLNPLTPSDHYSGRTAQLTSKRCILYIYSTNTRTEYFKQGIYCPFSSLQNAVCFIILTYLVPVLFTFYIQGVLKLNK